ncbi:hypothetical protein BDZ90DRAFT_229391 [Jaminaea rosea]|uniref:YABBY protein C-terminal domain-containing protein n=1 Tax=Jaminaea rosea TaxID=1569628 RepID=A0A316V1E9_9BASI|nr:hypothetical protein BDZ90DRAFT_229391 [Jaminaea rosea]PWN30371.1 hypothetical protein BDZ90DRAFT_229391 [Jaminaea rosea]
MPPKKTSSAGGKKKVSPYNLYMKEQLAKLKTSHPNLSHKERFQQVAKDWAKSPANPKNKK